MEFLTPKFRSDELTCIDGPTGLLPYDAAAAIVSMRIKGIDEAREDCRQKLNRVRMKIEVTDEIVSEMNARKNLKR